MAQDVWGLAVVIMLHRNPRNTDLIDYSIVKHWYTGKYTDRPAGRRHHDQVLAEGSFVHPEPVHDVQLTLDGIGPSDGHVRAVGGMPATPGRERSGQVHAPLQETDQPELPLGPPEPTPTPAA